MEQYGFGDGMGNQSGVCAPGMDAAVNPQGFGYGGDVAGHGLAEMRY